MDEPVTDEEVNQVLQAFRSLGLGEDLPDWAVKAAYTMYAEVMGDLSAYMIKGRHGNHYKQLEYLARRLVEIVPAGPTDA